MAIWACATLPTAATFEKGHGAAAEALARRLAGDNGPAKTVSFGPKRPASSRPRGKPVSQCEAQRVDQAHQPDEYVDVVQMQRGADMMSRLVAELAPDKAQSRAT